MSENSNSANGNSWSLLTQGVKESGVENVGPVAEGRKVEELLSKAPEPSPEANSDLEKHSSEASTHQPETETSSQPQSDPAFTHGSAQAQETQVTSPETNDGRAQLNSAHVDEDSSSTTVEDVSSWTPDREERDALTGHSESPDSFSDSYTHINPTSGSNPLPASVCQERERFKSDEESLRKTITEESKEVLETKGKEEDGLRRRKISHLGSLDRTEVEDDEEGEEEEDFQPPQREEEKVFSLNKCILAAVILLGLGTIFFSEADVDSKELRDPTNQEWLNLEVSRDIPVGLQPPDILSKQADEDQQILVLQAQLQQHQGELKAAAEEGEKERLRREELENEYQRIKGELERVPALQNELKQENERMKEENLRAKKELEAFPSLQRELEELRAKISQLTQSTERGEPVHHFAASRIPPAGDKRDVPPIERQEIKHRKTGDKKSEEKEQRKGDQEWKKKKSGKKEDDKERKERGTEGERTREQKDWKKDKSHQEEGKAGKRKEWMKDKKRDDGKMVKEREDKKYFKEWEEKEDKKGKKDKHVGQEERKGDKKDWKDTGKKKGKEEKEWKPRGERKEEKDWKSDKQSGRNEHIEWKGEKEWRKEKSEAKRNDKTEKKWKGEREFGGKEIKEKHRREKEREPKEEEWKREELKEEKKNKAFYHKNEGVKSEKEKQWKERHEHGAPDEKTLHHHSEHENYWSKQRARIQHFTGQRETCSGVVDCARAEGLSPVGLRDFETLLQSYLNKLQDPEDQTSREQELHKLVKEFFTDGVFTHDQMPFSEFVEDVGDILEDMAEGEESDSDIEGEESDEDDDDEMEGFEREAMEKFALPEELRKVEKKAEQKKGSGRVKG